MEQLKLHVERIVRPIRGGAGRKNRMRNELFAHLVQKAEGLIADGADQTAACNKAIEQLGDPSFLRADLQATVPAIERVAYVRLPAWRLCDNYFEKDDDESVFHFALVRTAFIAFVIGALLLIALSARWSGLLASRPHHTSSGYCALMALVIYFSVIASSFAGYYLTEVTGLRRMMSKKTGGPAWRKGGALCLFLCATYAMMLVPILLFSWIVNPADAAILIGVFSGSFGRKFALGFIVALLALVGISSIAMKFEHEQWAKWGSLRVNDE